MIYNLEFFLTSFLILALVARGSLFFYSDQASGNFSSTSLRFVHYVASFWGILLFVCILRSFVAQLYVVPTGSLMPTVVPGDVFLGNQFAYGLRLPVLRTKIFEVDRPNYGDIVFFQSPKDPSMILVKRVVGLPGDHVEYQDKTLIINGEVQAQDWAAYHAPYTIKEESLHGIKHMIQVHADVIDTLKVDVHVPEGHYFMMGDNRDESNDSRYWGAVPDEMIMGKAEVILFSHDQTASVTSMSDWSHLVHFTRSGTRLGRKASL